MFWTKLLNFILLFSILIFVLGCVENIIGILYFSATALIELTKVLKF